MTKTEALKKAREALMRIDAADGDRNFLSVRESDSMHLVIETIDDALAEPEPMNYALAAAMPGCEAWTLAVFKASDAPVGTRVYFAAPTAQVQP